MPEALTRHALFREYGATGRFWLPADPGTSWWGQLRFLPGDVTRVTLDEPPWTQSSREGIDLPVLFGRLADGTPCTLLHGWAQLEIFHRDQRYVRADVFARQLVLGAHLAGDEPEIASLSCEFTHLEQWLGFPYSVRHDDDGRRSELSLEVPQLAVAAEWEGQPFRVASECHRSVPDSWPGSGGSWTYTYRLVITPTRPQPVAWFTGGAACLRGLVAFLVGSGVYTLDLRPRFAMRAEGTAGEGRLLQAVDIPALVRTEVYYFSTRFADVADRLPDVAASWFQNSGRLSVVMRTYAETLTNEGASSASVFLGLVQVLEHFHGLLFPRTTVYFDKQTWGRFCDGVGPFLDQGLAKAGVNEGDRESTVAMLVGRMRGLNQASLQTKLEQLLRHMDPSPLMYLAGNPPSLESTLKELPRRIADTRHFLTHYSEEQAAKALSGRELEEAAASCWGVLTYWLGRQVGLPDELASDMARRAKHAMFVISQRAGL